MVANVLKLYAGFLFAGASFCSNKNTGYLVVKIESNEHQVRMAVKADCSKRLIYFSSVLDTLNVNS